MTDANYTKKIYNKFGRRYHAKMLKVGESFWNRFIEIPAMNSQLKSIVKNKKVLDLGCGSGLSTKRLIKMGAKVAGIDISEIMIEIASKENPKVKFYVCDARKTPFKKNEFDVVSSSLTVHYFKNLNSLFKEVSRITKKGGYFVFSFHHPLSSVLKKRVIKHKKVYVFTNYFHNKKYAWEMIKGMKMISYHHTFEVIVNSLNKNGFIVERLIEPQPVKRARKINKKNYNKTSRMPSFCVIRARKV